MRGEVLVVVEVFVVVDCEGIDDGIVYGDGVDGRVDGVDCVGEFVVYDEVGC